MSRTPGAPIRLGYNAYDPIDGVDASLSPVLFLHGLTVFKENWGDIPQNVANATKRKTFALDARNHGDSEWSDQFSFDLNAQDLLHFLEKEKIDKAILVGHSMGGITGIKTALMQPDKVEKLVVEDMYVKPPPKEILGMIVSFVSIAKKAIEAAPADLDEKGTKKFVLDYIQSNLPPEMQNQRRDVKDSEMDRMLSLKKDENGRYVFKTNLEVIARTVANSDTIVTPAVGKYEGPACFIYGKNSPMKVDAEEEHIRKHFPNAVFEGIENATHSVHNDCPIEFTDALLKFIS